jgi:glycerophosphoryl diester phosphodiesterase
VTSNPWLERRVLDFAHQGGAREAPSTTLLALRQAVAAGADALELDVHATSDRHLVVCHDPTVDATTNGTGPIATFTLQELQALDNAYWWVPGQIVAPGRPDVEYVYRGRAPLDPTLRVATLQEVLEEFPRTFLNLDIKQTAPAVEPYEAELAKMLREYGRTDDVIVASFHDAATEAFSAVAPEIPTSFGTTATAIFVRAVFNGIDPPPFRHAALQLPTTFQGLTLIDERLIRAAHQAGIAVHVWTIDEPREMARLIELGVDGIMTDRPTVLEEVLDELDVHWTG